MSRFYRLLFLGGFGLGGVAILLSLGFWQLDRMVWKRELIAAVAARAGEDPREATGRETQTASEHRSVRATGRYAAEPAQLRFLTSIKGVGPGFRLIAPFVLESGARIMVDRGFAPETVAPRHQPAPAPPEGPQELLGVLRWPNESSRFTPAPNRAEGIWFARDVASMAAALRAEPVLLVLSPPVSADGREPLPSAWPAPVQEKIDLPNNHLGYALTWFSLAAIWLAMSAFWAFKTRRTGGEAAA